MRLNFYGAAQEVTGSNYVMDINGYKIGIDCGLFQGSRELELKNYEDFSFNPKDLDVMIMTHAHIDHSGRLPKLVKDGFNGRIYCTGATGDLLEIMLKDSAHIQKTDTDWENARRKRSGKPLVSPLYNEEDVDFALKKILPQHYDEVVAINEKVAIRFRDAGHILGSAIVELWVDIGEEKIKLVFSGDLGMPGRPIIKDPEYIESCDYLILESTYGNTVHPPLKESMDDLMSIVEETALKGGTVLIPSFAVGRTQELIYELNSYYENYPADQEYKRVPVYIDSPLAIEATKIFMKNSYSFNDQAKEIIQTGDNVFDFSNLHYIKSVEESKLLNKVRFPRLIISSSGMATAGRVRHHLKHCLWDENSSVVFIGYQAHGSLGRLLIDGVKQVKIAGEEIAVKAKIHSLQGFSAHADSDFIMKWLGQIDKKPVKIFLTHGELEESEPLKKRIEEDLSIDCIIPTLGSNEEIMPTGRQSDESIDFDSCSLENEMRELYLNLDYLIAADIEDKIDCEKSTEIKSTLKDINSRLMDLIMLTGR